MQLRFRQVRRFSYSPPKGAGDRDNSSFFSLLTMATVIGGVAYVYYDPDVLPEGIKKWLPIQEPKGHGMSIEEYEQWRAKQANKFPNQLFDKKEEETQGKKRDEEQSDEVNPPSMDADIPIPRGDVSPAEMKASLEKLLREARENEAAYIADLKKSKAALTEEDRQMLQAFKDEKARLKQQLKFIKSSNRYNRPA